jgi:hypothetical protein
MNKNKISTLRKVDKTLDKILHQVVSVIGARKLNKNSYDDDLKETWENFRTEAKNLEKEVSRFVSFLQLEDGEI